MEKGLAGNANVTRATKNRRETETKRKSKPTRAEGGEILMERLTSSKKERKKGQLRKREKN